MKCARERKSQGTKYNCGDVDEDSVFEKGMSALIAAFSKPDGRQLSEPLPRNLKIPVSSKKKPVFSCNWQSPSLLLPTNNRAFKHLLRRLLLLSEWHWNEQDIVHQTDILCNVHCVKSDLWSNNVISALQAFIWLFSFPRGTSITSCTRHACREYWWGVHFLALLIRCICSPIALCTSSSARQSAKARLSCSMVCLSLSKASCLIVCFVSTRALSVGKVRS